MIVAYAAEEAVVQIVGETVVAIAAWVVAGVVPYVVEVEVSVPEEAAWEKVGQDSAWASG